MLFNAISIYFTLFFGLVRQLMHELGGTLEDVLAETMKGKPKEPKLLLRSEVALISLWTFKLDT